MERSENGPFLWNAFKDVKRLLLKIISIYHSTGFNVNKQNMFFEQIF